MPAGQFMGVHAAPAYSLSRNNLPAQLQDAREGENGSPVVEVLVLSGMGPGSRFHHQQVFVEQT